MVGDTEQQENDGIVTENDEIGSENVSPDVMKVSDSGCEQPYIWSTTPDAQNIPKSRVLTSENGSNSTSGAGRENGQNGTSEGNGDQIKRELQRGSRICFRFDTCRSGGKYVGPSMRRADAGQDARPVANSLGRQDKLFGEIIPKQPFCR